MLIKNARRPMIPLIATGILAVLLSGPAGAQGSDEKTIQGLRACAQIDDMADRTACYDGYLRPGAPAAGQRGRAQATPAAPSAAALPVSAGRDWTGRRHVEAPRTPAIETVTAAVQRAPGVYLLTMKGGAQWQFASTVRATYDPPGDGATVEIRPGALGSYLLSYNGQSVVRVIRVR
jgi:hypothetical protein